MRCKRLSEPNKLFVLTHVKYDTDELSLGLVYQDSIWMHMAPRQYTKRQPVWEYAVSSDNVQCMDTLLRQTPLYAIHKEKCSSRSNMDKKP